MQITTPEGLAAQLNGLCPGGMLYLPVALLGRVLGSPLRAAELPALIEQFASRHGCLTVNGSAHGAMPCFVKPSPVSQLFPRAAVA